MSRLRSPSNTLIFGDPHGPYHHPKALAFLAKQKARWNPDRVICSGDLTDGLTASRYRTQSDAMGADDEHRAGVRFLTRLAHIFPVLEVVRGNHDLRADKKAADNGIAMDRIRPVQEVPALRKPLSRWTWHEELWVNSTTVVIHGDGLGGQNPGEDAVLQHRANVVMGHLHIRAGAIYYARGRWRNWVLHTGCLMNPKSAAGSYAKYNKKKQILGCGVLIDDEYPMFIPM